MAEAQATPLFICEAIEPSQCATCGQPSSRKYCSNRCIDRRPRPGRKRNRCRKRNRSDWKSAPILQCQGCASPFKPKRTDRLKYCSRQCAFSHFDAWRAPETLAKPKRPSKPAPKRECVRCGAPLDGKRRLYCLPCSTYSPKPKLVRPCISCGTGVIGTAARKYCQSCRRRLARKQYRLKHGSVKKHRDRARRYGLAYEPINPIQVFDRDAWRCQICGTRTPKRLRGTFEGNAPELDHRVPMAMGGPHTWDNVQCACRACNIAKGGKQIQGQMRLL